MSAPFPITTITIHKISGRELNAAIFNATGHEFDPVADGAVPGDDSEGTLEVLVRKGDEYATQAYAQFKGSGSSSWSPRGVISGFLLTLANAGTIPFGTYQITYTWG